MMSLAMRVLRAILGIRFPIALLALGALIVVATVGGVLGNTDHTGITSQADLVIAPTVMVHADHPTLARTRCVWKAVDGSLRICHRPSAGLVYRSEAGP
jgi:hypothetical protein